MPDYNKGDFTQQGIDGFVEGGLHLNEKRCLTAKISTDEEQAGIDSIEINIHDHLNDLDYTFSGENVIAGSSVIGQAPSGNIEITENTAEGEPLDISQYATATVNVAGGGGLMPLIKYSLTSADGSNRAISFGECIGPFLVEQQMSEVFAEINGTIYYDNFPTIRQDSTQTGNIYLSEVSPSTWSLLISESWTEETESYTVNSLNVINGATDPDDPPGLYTVIDPSKPIEITLNFTYHANEV